MIPAPLDIAAVRNMKDVEEMGSLAHSNLVSNFLKRFLSNINQDRAKVHAMFLNCNPIVFYCTSRINAGRNTIHWCGENADLHKLDR